MSQNVSFNALCLVLPMHCSAAADGTQLHAHPVPGDGACWYHAVLLALQEVYNHLPPNLQAAIDYCIAQGPRSGRELQLLLVEWLKLLRNRPGDVHWSTLLSVAEAHNPDIAEPLEAIDAYLEYLATPGVYAESIITAATAWMTGFNIAVHYPGVNGWTWVTTPSDFPGAPFIYIAHQHFHFEPLLVTPPLQEAAVAPPMPLAASPSSSPDYRSGLTGEALGALQFLEQCGHSTAAKRNSDPQHCEEASRALRLLGIALQDAGHFATVCVGTRGASVHGCHVCGSAKSGPAKTLGGMSMEACGMKAQHETCA